MQATCRTYSKSNELNSLRLISSRNAWILGPVADILLCCGGILWLVFSLDQITHHVISEAAGNFVTELFMISGGIMFVETHFGLTYLRAKVSAKKSSARLFSHIAPWLAVLILMAVASLQITTFLCKLYLLAVVLHYSMQTYTFVDIYLSKGGYELGRLPKLCLWMLINGLGVYAILTQLIDPALNLKEFLGLSMPFWGPVPIWTLHCCALLLLTCSIVFSLSIWREFVKKGQIVPFPAMLLIISFVGLFALSGPQSQALWLYVPAFLHGGQSIAQTIAWTTGQGRCARNRLFAACLLGVAIVYSLPFALILLGFDSRLCYPAVITWFSFHHFVGDALFMRSENE